MRPWGPFDRSQILGPNCYNFWSHFYSSRTVCVDCVGCLCHDLCIKSCCDMYEALNGRLIGSKAWNRGGKMLETQVDSP